MDQTPRQSMPSWGLNRQGWFLVGATVAGCCVPLVVNAPHIWWVNATLITALLASLVEMIWTQPHLSGSWLLPREPHAGTQVSMGARLLSRRQRRPATIYAWHPDIGLYQPTGSIPPAPAEHITRCAWHTTFERRGRHDLPPIIARSQTLLGCCFRQAVVNKPTSVIVLPALGTMHRTFRHRLERFMEDGRSGLREGDDDIIRLRPYQLGDPPRLVQWKSSARAQRLLVGVRGLPTNRHLALLLDTRSSNAQSPRIERLVAIAATIIDHCLERQWIVSLHGNFAQGGFVSGHRSHLMQVLALLEVEDPATTDEPEAPPGSCLSLGLHPSEQLRAQRHVLALDLDEAEELVALPRSLRRKRR